MRDETILIFAVGVSGFGMLIAILLAVNPPSVNESFFWRKPLVGFIFALICVSGILAALFPKQCSHRTHLSREGNRLTSNKIHSSSHHPNCAQFSAHMIHVKGRQLCAACTGLAIGAIMTIFGTFVYFFVGWLIEGFAFLTVLIGVLGVILGFLQLEFRSLVRLALNVFFVLGALLILIGIDALIESLFVDVFLLGIIVFWIFTRIQLSQWDHYRICSKCDMPCETQ